jgi:putative transposase
MMKRSRFTQEQIIGVLKEHQAGATAADLCRKHGISDATFYTWRSKYGGMDVSDARKLKGLEEENAKLKRLLAEQMLDVATLKERLAKTYGPSCPQAVSRPGLISLRQRIRSRGNAPAKMEIRASWSS